MISINIMPDPADFIVQEENNSIAQTTLGNSRINAAGNPENPHSPLELLNDTEIDAFFISNGTTGTSWDTAYILDGFIFNQSSVGSGIIIKNNTRYLIIRNCSFYNSGPNVNYDPLEPDSGIFINNSQNIRIENCDFQKNLKISLFIYYASNIVVKSCTFFDNSDSLTTLNSVNCTIESNIFSEAGGLAGSDVANFVVKNNIIENSTFTAMWYGDNCSDSIFHNNSIRNIGTNGIVLGEAVNVTLTSNYVKNCSVYSIQLTELNSSVIDQNIVENGNIYGFYIIALQDSNITSNIAFNNSKDGMFFEGSHFLRVESNVVAKNKNYGMRTYASNDSIFFQNTFYKNELNQAYEFFSNNTWDNGTHGNFYSDYRERYPDAQKVDGFWNTPYNITVEEASVDRYPLIEDRSVNSLPYSSENLEDAIEFSNNTAIKEINWIIFDGYYYPETNYTIIFDNETVDSGDWFDGMVLDYLIPTNLLGNYSLILILDDGCYFTEEIYNITIVEYIDDDPIIPDDNGEEKTEDDNDLLLILGASLGVGALGIGVIIIRKKMKK